MSSTLRQRDVKSATASKGKAATEEIPEEAKFIVPNFTNKQLMDAIPAWCFERSALKSTQYLVQDVAAIGILAYGAAHIEEILQWAALPEPYTQIARAGMWAFYMIFSSFFGAGLWVVGHECGHQAYSTSKTLNNTLGWFVHSALLVPYHSWRISHGRHHAATGSLTRDEVFVPRTRSDRALPAPKDDDEIAGIHVSHESQSAIAEALDHVPVVVFWTMMYQLAGFPLYLIMNAAGQTRYPKWTNHFNPNAVIFRANQRWQVIMSGVGIFLVLAGCAYWSHMRSFKEMMLYYGIPYLMVNWHIVHITYLQHTDPTLPHYSDKLWTFPRGALSTIDRTFYGPIGTYCVHGLCETHVAHHICSRIPHHNAWAATAALKEFLGIHYQISHENMLVSLWKSHRECSFVEDTADVAFYKNYRGVAQKVGVLVDHDSGIDTTVSETSSNAED